MKRIILGMAKSKKEAFKNLESKTSILLKHLVKLYMYPKHESREHWMKEIALFINEAPRLKSSNKLPKESDILKYTWDVWEDSFLNWVKVLPEDYGEPDFKIDLEDLYLSCQLYFEWLATQLSNTGAVSKAAVRSKLINLGF